MEVNHRADRRGSMRRYIQILARGSMVIMLMISLSACSKIKREFTLHQATKALDKGDYKTAIAKFKEVLEVDQKDPSVYYNLGVAYVDNNQNKQAQTMIQKLREMDAGDYADILQEIIDKAARGGTGK